MKVHEGEIAIYGVDAYGRRRKFCHAWRDKESRNIHLQTKQGKTDSMIILPHLEKRLKDL